jgi:hypothetical protein
MSAAGFASTPEPPYYAVIFTSTRTSIDEGNAGMAVTRAYSGPRSS